MSTGGTYDSYQKQKVRERLWDAAFRRCLEHVEADSVQYLCFPAAECLYLKQIEETFGIGKQGIVAVEKLDESHTAIHSYLSGQGIALLGEYEHLVMTERLTSLFPFHIINLDFCGQGFVFPDLDHPLESDPSIRRWRAVEATLQAQSSVECEQFEFLLTLAGQRDNAAGKKYLRERVDSLNALCGMERDLESEPDWKSVALVVPSIIADLAAQLRYKVEAFDMLGYRQDDHSYNMVSWAFQFIRSRETLGDGAQARGRRVEAFIRDYYPKNPDFLGTRPSSKSGARHTRSGK
jgi:hypothetical protein